MSIVTPPMLSLQAISGSFPFQTKYIPLPGNTKAVLGSQVQDPSSGFSPPTRRATTTNGLFAPRSMSSSDGSQISVSPLSLGVAHAEVWSWNGQIFIQDLDSAFGTYVNGGRINTTTALKNGDILNLGSQLIRNANTPAYVTEDHLKPIIAKVSLVGVPSR